MKVRSPGMLILVAILLTTSRAVLAGDDQLPQKLRELRTQVGCGPVSGFYDRPGMVEPPYLYGYLPGGKEESAAFWCHREGAEKPFVLVLVEKGRVTSTIAWQNYPGGLSLDDSAPLRLSDFRYVDKPEQRGPVDAKTTHPSLRSEYDGVITLFYHHGDRWLYRLLD